MSGFESNGSLDNAMRRVFWRERVGLLDRIRIRRALRDEEVREEIEYGMSRMLAEAGLVAGDLFDSNTGIFVGDWLDIFDWIIANWSTILEMIMTIIGLFSGTEED